MGSAGARGERSRTTHGSTSRAMMRATNNETGMRADARKAAYAFREESMYSSLFRALLAAALCMASIAAWAHEDTTQEPLPFLDCDHPPEHAVSIVPEPI